MAVDMKALTDEIHDGSVDDIALTLIVVEAAQELSTNFAKNLTPYIQALDFALDQLPQEETDATFISNGRSIHDPYDLESR